MSNYTHETLRREWQQLDLDEQVQAVLQVRRQAFLHGLLAGGMIVGLVTALAFVSWSVL